jgi:uncharacterized protein YciI
MLNTYIYLLRPATPGILGQMLPKQEAIMDQHFARLQQSLHDGRLLLAGPCEDEAFGIVIFRAHSIDDAQQFINDDPAILSGLMSAELHPFRISLAADDIWLTEDASE